jgi:hypothetical protein
MLHGLRATGNTAHWGYFDASLAPALRVKSADVVQIEAITHHAADAADFAAIQVVDGRQGVHVRIPRSVFPPRKNGKGGSP